MGNPELKVLKDEGITIIEGIECYGSKEGKNGLGIVKCNGIIAGVFTKNKITAAPVIYTKDVVKGGIIDGIVVNSGNANAYTGEKGVRDAKKMAELLAEKIGSEPRKIAVASTGVIGVPLNMRLIKNGIDTVFSKIGSNRDSSRNFARSIMTTDSYPKEFTVKIEDCIISGVAKGAGMIAPNMATMLSFIFTDAKFTSRELYGMLKAAVDKSFNVTVVDGDTSTNDTVLLVATGKKKIDRSLFQKGLNTVCYNLAKLMAKDGEGASKLIEVHVKGAVSEEDAFKAARAVVSSTLVKTAVFGNDPNWGRIVAAVGYSGAEVDEKLSLGIEGKSESEYVTLVEKGVILDREKARAIMVNNDEIKFIIDLHKGNYNGFAVGCDLTYDYVKINAEYTT